jgi:hypothetical protein
MNNIFVVEHLVKGFPIVDTVRGVEDIDLSMFTDIVTLWVCGNEEEVAVIEQDLKDKHDRRN